MQNPTGIFIVIEGSDGSGKTTQFNLLKARLQAIGHEVDIFKFPQYDNPSSHFIKKYLAGEYGNASSISPYTASLFYAMDRFEGAPEIRKSIEAGHIALSDRYVGANMAHQGSKFTNPAEQRGFFVWEDNLEFELLGIPRPTLTFFLRVPAEISQRLILERAAKTGVKPDEHEADINHLRKAVGTYETLCQLFPNDFRAIDCVKDGQLMSIPDINNLIWDQILPLLPTSPAKAAHAVTLNLEPSRAAPAKAESAKSQSQQELSLAAISDCELIEPGALSYSLDWTKNNYAYYVPPQLPKKAKQKYEQIMSRLIDLHKTMHAKLERAKADSSATYLALPLAAMLRVKAQATQSQTDSLAKSPNVEVQALAAQLDPTVVRVAHTPNRPEALHDILTRLAGNQPKLNQADDADSLQVLEAWPRNEFILLADSLHALSDLSRNEIEAKLDAWSYEQKYDALQAALKENSQALTSQVRYRFDIVTDRLSLAQLRTLGIATQLSLRPTGLRYGFSTPETIEPSQLEDEYRECVEQSQELYRTLQAVGREDLADYAMLLGHRVRTQFGCSLASLDRLDQLADRNLAVQILQKISEVHPTLSLYINSVEQSPAKTNSPVASRKRSTRRRRR